MIEITAKGPEIRKFCPQNFSKEERILVGRGDLVHYHPLPYCPRFILIPRQRWRRTDEVVRDEQEAEGGIAVCGLFV